jgi:hypothetical protein
MKTPIKYPPPTRDRWAFWQWSDIPSCVNEGFVYLRRLRVIQTPWFSVLIHWIHEADVGRWPHDHPWVFWSWILRGYYQEDYWPDTSWMYRQKLGPIPQVWKKWSLHKMPYESAHKITYASEGLTTLVITGRRRRAFRFWTDERPVRWDLVRPKEINDVD